MKIKVTIKDLKDAIVVIPTSSPLNFFIRPAQKTDGSWRMLIDYWKFSQVMTSVD